MTFRSLIIKLKVFFGRERDWRVSSRKSVKTWF